MAGNSRIYIDFGMNRRTTFLHRVAVELKNVYGISEFGGCVYLRDEKNLDYLQKQTDIKYTSLDIVNLMESDALKTEPDYYLLYELENDPDMSLGNLIVADRNIGHFFVKGAARARTRIMELSTHENIIRFVSFFFKYFLNRLDEFKPQAVVSVVAASLHATVLAHCCRRLEIPYYLVVHTRIRNYYTILKNSITERMTDVEQEYFKVKDFCKFDLKSEASEYVDSFINRPVVPDYMESINENVGRAARKSWASYIKDWAKPAERIRTLFFSLKSEDEFLRTKKPWSRWMLELRKTYELKRSERYFEKSRAGTENYIYYPLHVNPESSTMVLAPNFVNQLQIIELLAKNIPVTYKLYVKEHIPSLGKRPKGFYEEIKSYPNVRLLSPWEDNFSLIKGASAACVITGTTGWEAVLLGVLVINFGNCWYERFGFTRRCAEPDRLHSIIIDAVNNGMGMSCDERVQRLKALVSIVLSNSFRFETSAVWAKQYDGDSEEWVKVLAAELNKRFMKDKIFSASDEKQQ